MASTKPSRPPQMKFKWEHIQCGFRCKWRLSKDSGYAGSIWEAHGSWWAECPKRGESFYKASSKEDAMKYVQDPYSEAMNGNRQEAS